MYFVALAVRGCIPYRGPSGIEGELTKKLNLQNNKEINTDTEFSCENIPEEHSNSPLLILFFLYLILYHKKSDRKH